MTASGDNLPVSILTGLSAFERGCVTEEEFPLLGSFDSRSLRSHSRPKP
jgi:hypothetical protein